MDITKSVELLEVFAKCVSPTAYALSEILIRNKNEVTGELPEVSQDNITLDALKEQITIAQDLAIARRIETAEEVEIEEFYDNSKKGNIGLSGNVDGVNIGVSGSGRIISKRIYKFKGYNKERSEQYEEAINSVLKIKNGITNTD